jgi:hypothetical protein
MPLKAHQNERLLPGLGNALLQFGAVGTFTNSVGSAWTFTFLSVSFFVDDVECLPLRAPQWDTSVLCCLAYNLQCITRMLVLTKGGLL